ncbi:hypothetical protein P154DRAFT_525774 [Amniculicola lignicola CBS 123094]|uniref:Uncharacterized protein n=1 Tax=Amniculicola lignicola CBS 123094 TaxID=1392246 RepID=A0A6A5W5J4_9PLEO|nr:hypothetical protein P154DRAFT_525774 [Amniculicola lignicola CBS 123094]
MGGHAFRSLYCPRFSLEIYLTTRTLATKVLNTLFTHVVEPAELPSKTNFGDLDFLVAGPKHAPSSPVDQPHLVELIKAALNTEYGRRSLPTDGVLFFAIPAPGREEEFHIQIDVHVVEVEGFEWNHFMYRYASGLKMVGSMVKPLGVTLDPKGCHVRVEEMERGDGPGSMVFVTREPNEVLEIVGLGRKFLEGGFGVNENCMDELLRFGECRLADCMDSV